MGPQDSSRVAAGLSLGPPAKRLKPGDGVVGRATRAPQPDELVEGTPVIYSGGSRGFVRDAYAPLDEFWVADAESGELVRDSAGEIATFKSQDLRLVADAAPPSLSSLDGHGYSGVLLIGREELMVSVLQHMGEPDLQERRNPQQLLAIPCPDCGPTELQTAASTGIVEELLALGRRLRPDIHVGVRALQLRHVAEQLGGELLILEGLYVLAAVQLPYPLKSCEVPGINMRERHRRKEIANQVDLTVTAACEHSTAEDSVAAARRALKECCRIELTDSLWGEAAQMDVRRRLDVPDLPLHVKDSTGLEVFVIVLPKELSVLTLHGVLTFRDCGLGNASGVGGADAAAGSQHPLTKADADAGEGKIQGKTVREWEAQQTEFAALPKLPTGWLRVRSRSSGEVYFFNKSTQESTFELPEAPLPVGWTKQVSKSTGKTYYWHAGKGLSTFQRPTE